MIRIKKPKIGLALGSGAARGLAHIGVLKALIEEGISINMIAGSSMGALVGAYFARYKKIAEFEELVLETDWKKLLGMADFNLALMFKGFIHGQKVKELLRAIIGDIEFKDLKIPLAVVATDVNTGEEVIIKEGSVIDAVRASISIPGIFMPVKYGRRFLIDGGVVNPVPADVVRNMGATFVIACNVIQRSKRIRTRKPTKKQKISFGSISNSQAKRKTLSSLSGRLSRIIQKNKFENFRKVFTTFQMKIQNKVKRVDPNTPSIFEVIIQSIYSMEYEIAKLRTKEADVVITPDVGNLAALEFYRGKEPISEGYKATKEAMPNIRKLIKSL
jgi:NTE family protein